MDQDERLKKKNSEYESLHKTVIVSEKIKPISIIMPFIVIVLIISVMFVYTYVQKSNVVRNAEYVTNQMAEHIANNIDGEMDYAQTSIRFASFTLAQSMTSDTIENPAEIINPMVANSPFGGIEYIRADGMNVMNIGEPFDASDRVYYIEGIKGNTGVWNNFHPKTSKETLMNFYTPIIYQDKISGVLTGYIEATTQISQIFERKLYGHDIYGLLVDENDMVICSTIESEYIKDLTLDILLSNKGVTDKQKASISDIIHNASGNAKTIKDSSGEGRVCAVTVPDTEWKVVIIIPEKSAMAIISENSKASVITIFIISFILLLYAAVVLLKNIKRRRVIAKENAKLEEENRVYNEENKRAFNEISEIRDINASANMGTWRMKIVEGKTPSLHVDNTMKELMGFAEKDWTPEEAYKNWYERITPGALLSVLSSVEKMKQGKFDENTYLWNHPKKGERYVRCGGTAQKIEGGYLLSGYHYDVDDVVREDLAQIAMLQDTLNERNEYYNTLGMLAEVYNTLHIIYIKEDKIIKFNGKDEFKDVVNKKQSAKDMLYQVFNELIADEYIERALEFADISTLADRLKGKKFIYTQLVSKRIGWFIATFIALESDNEGNLTKVIFTTQNIDEAKKQEEKLIYKSRTDELTGLLNRRAYEEDIYEQNDIPVNDRFVSMSLDVNGLKVVNDTLGHAAGDELLIGASWCMKNSLGAYGKLYRTGGDEFIAILFCDSEKLKEVLSDFDEKMANWKGKLVDSLTVSYGYVSTKEEPEMSVRELGVIADKRMYAAKAAHYRKKGIDRRKNRDAHRALCDLYTKILRINLLDDTYQIENMDKNEMSEEKGFSGKLSVWLSSFGENGYVHPDDLQEYIKKTDVKYIHDHFVNNKEPLRIFYRRKYEAGFRKVIMEITPSNDYSEENQSLYLYVKDIDDY